MPEKLQYVSVDDFMHPEDLAAMKALQKVKAVEKLVSQADEKANQIMVRMMTLGSCVRLTDKNAPHICGLVHTACDIMGYDKIPEIYTRREYSLDVTPSGVNQPVIIIPDLALNMLDDKLLYFTVGRAITRFKSNYLKFYMVAQLILLSSGFFPVVSDAIKILLANWMRKSELTADRGGLLVCQDYKVAMRFLMTKAGMPIKETERVSIPDYIEATQIKSFLVKAGKEVKTLVNTNGWANDRINELFQWYADGSYDNILEDNL